MAHGYRGRGGLRGGYYLADEPMSYEDQLNNARARERRRDPGPSKVLGGNFGHGGLYRPAPRGGYRSIGEEARAMNDAEDQAIADQREEAQFRRYKELVAMRRQRDIDAREAEKWEREKRKQVVDYHQGLEALNYKREMDRRAQERQDRLDQQNAVSSGLQNAKAGYDLAFATRSAKLLDDPLHKAVANVAMGLPQDYGRDPVLDGGIGGSLGMNPDGSMTLARPDGSKTTINPQVVNAILEKQRGLSVSEWRPATPKPAWKDLAPDQKGVLLNKIKSVIQYQSPGGGMFPSDFPMTRETEARLVAGALNGMTPRELMALVPPEMKPVLKLRDDAPELDTPLYTKPEGGQTAPRQAPQPGAGLQTQVQPQEQAPAPAREQAQGPVGGIVTDRELQDLNEDGKVDAKDQQVKEWRETAIWHVQNYEARKAAGKPITPQQQAIYDESKVFLQRFQKGLGKEYDALLGRKTR